LKFDSVVRATIFSLVADFFQPCGVGLLNTKNVEKKIMEG
jgi:hypothetical protein